MTRHARLRRNGDVPAERGAAGDACLRDDDGVGTDDHVVGDLHQVIDLDPLADMGAAKAGTIDRRVRANLGVIVDLNRAGVWNLDELASLELVAEAVRTDDRAAVHDDARAPGRSAREW